MKTISTECYVNSVLFKFKALLHNFICVPSGVTFPGVSGILCSTELRVVPFDTAMFTVLSICRAVPWSMLPSTSPTIFGCVMS